MVSEDPNKHISDLDIVPDWPLYADGSDMMIFNKTESGEPDIAARVIDQGLVERCQ